MVPEVGLADFRDFARFFRESGSAAGHQRSKAYKQLEAAIFLPSRAAHLRFPVPHRTDDRGHGPTAPTAPGADHAVKHPLVDVQPRRIEPIIRDDLGREMAIPSAGAGDVEIVLASHARTYAEHCEAWEEWIV